MRAAGASLPEITEDEPIEEVADGKDLEEEIGGPRQKRKRRDTMQFIDVRWLSAA